MFVAHLTRLVAKTGGTLHARFHFPDQTVSILPPVWAVPQEATITALARVPVWLGTGAA
jgi:hypothetical protein